MPMTHYMELLATRQPWNLILFMAIPVILAETVAICELSLLHSRRYDGPVRTVSRLAGIAVGIYFAGVFVYLTATAVVPLTRDGLWRGPADVVAVVSYLAGVVPLGAIALIDLGVVARRLDAHARMGWHAAMVALFLVVAHVAMIVGMLDPTLLGAVMPHAVH